MALSPSLFQRRPTFFMVFNAIRVHLKKEFSRLKKKKSLKTINGKMDVHLKKPIRKETLRCLSGKTLGLNGSTCNK